MSVAMEAAAPPRYDAEVLAQIVEFAPNGVALTTAAGRIVLANAELERMFGYTRAELLASDIGRLVPERFRSGHALLRADNGEDSRFRSMGAGRELVGMRADGTEFPIELGLNVLTMLDEVMIVETVVDISLRKSLEKMFQKMVEAAPCAMVMIDGLGRIVLTNPQCEQMFGYARTELIGNALEMLVPERFRAAHVGHRNSFGAAPSLRHVGIGRDLTARRKDGTEFPVEIGLNPVPGEKGGLVLAAVTDITYRKTMELDLRQVSANLEEFSYAASHELRAPLRGIADLIEWIGEDLGAHGSPEVLRNLGRVGDRIRRLDRVVDDLLTYAREGATSMDAVLIEPRELIAGILELQPLPCDFDIVVDVDAVPFVGARTPLETVLRNLLRNALQHHDRPDGCIRITAVDMDRYCVFTVSDDGPGVPVAAQERIFRMFQTLSAVSRASSGIGLALSKRLVELHGGRIAIESSDGRRGTSFRVSWPRFQWRKRNA